VTGGSGGGGNVTPASSNAAVSTKGSNKWMFLATLILGIGIGVVAL
jgi:hypothetical protein